MSLLRHEVTAKYVPPPKDEGEVIVTMSKDFAKRYLHDTEYGKSPYGKQIRSSIRSALGRDAR